MSLLLFKQLSSKRRRNSHFLLLQHSFYHSKSPINPPQPQPLQESVIANLILHNSTETTLTQTLENSSISWSPDLVNRVLKRLWNDGPKALTFFQSLENHQTYKHSSSSYDHAIDIAGRLKDYRTLWALVARMRTQRIGPTPKTFAIITERYVSAGKPDKAVKIFLSMHEYGCPQDLHSFNTVLDILCKSNRIEMAYHFFKVFRFKFRADVISYNIIANGWCLIKKTAKALEVLKEMVERGLKPSLSTYNVLLKGYFRAGQIKQAWDFFKEIKRRGCEIDVVTYTTVIHGFGIVGEIGKARKVFDEMIKRGCLPTVETYNAFIQVLCKKDNVENAIVIFDEMVSKGYVPNQMTYNVVIRGLCHAGEMDRAMEYMGRMKEDECEPNVQTFNVVIRYYCDTGELEKALEVFHKMDGGAYLPNVDTYNVLIGAMFVRKKPDDMVIAGRLLMEMVDKGFMPRRFTFNRVLNGLTVIGNHELAREILRVQSNSGRLPRAFKI
ncbi:hypothetical protein MKW94_016719 [Papaver nudicaule]|uniref:Pentatricopeptide repeat-containing protein n=1 Tax=Papaver nudicaule TaxID=74823 RepID=A0AA41S1D3_PAPNU|nr:hypothetical protein [Papaver nudicaule]